MRSFTSRKRPDGRLRMIDQAESPVGGVDSDSLHEDIVGDSPTRAQASDK